jgi:hypothetical protein
MSLSASPSRPPFVGREHELSLLLRALEGSLNGHGTLVWISREPGVGKTRLAQEIGAVAAARAHASSRAAASRQTAHRRTGHGPRSSGRSSENGAARISRRSLDQPRAGSRLSFRNFKPPGPRPRNSLQGRPHSIGSSSLTQFEPFCSGPPAIASWF